MIIIMSIIIMINMFPDLLLFSNDFLRCSTILYDFRMIFSEIFYDIRMICYDFPRLYMICVRFYTIVYDFLMICLFDDFL